MKTRGPNPNPTAQAQSKRCLPFLQKLKISLKYCPSGSPIRCFFVTFFKPFPDWCSQDTNMDPKGTQMNPKGAEIKPQGLPKVPKSLPTTPCALT